MFYQVISNVFFVGVFPWVHESVSNMYRVYLVVSSLSQIQTSGMVHIMDMHMGMKAMDMPRLPKTLTCMDILTGITSSRHHSSKQDIAENFWLLLSLPQFPGFVI
jgi:hypothetical protein